MVENTAKETEQKSTEQTSTAGQESDQAIRVEESKTAPSAKGPLASLGDIEQEVERAFDRFFKSGWLRPAHWELPSFPSLKDSFEGKSLKVNLIDRDDEVVVEAELPGVKKSDIQVSLDESRLTIKASTRKETEEEKGEYHRREISSGYYSRTMTLPALVDGSKAKASFEDGLLRVTLPKSETTRRRTVAID
jgi:HSP20 family protein